MAPLAAFCRRHRRLSLLAVSMLLQAAMAERPLTHRRQRAAALSRAAGLPLEGGRWSRGPEAVVERVFGLRSAPPSSLGQRAARDEPEQTLTWQRNPNTAEARKPQEIEPREHEHQNRYVAEARQVVPKGHVPQMVSDIEEHGLPLPEGKQDPLEQESAGVDMRKVGELQYDTMLLSDAAHDVERAAEELVSDREQAHPGDGHHHSQSEHDAPEDIPYDEEPAQRDRGMARGDGGELGYSRLESLLRDLAAESQKLRESLPRTKQRAVVSVDASSVAREAGGEDVLRANRDFDADAKEVMDGIARRFGSGVGGITQILQDVQGGGSAGDAAREREAPAHEEMAPPREMEYALDDDQRHDEEELKATLERDGLPKEQIERALKQVHEMDPASRKQLLEHAEPQQIEEATKLNIPLKELNVGTELYAKMQDCSKDENNQDPYDCEKTRAAYEEFLDRLIRSGAQLTNEAVARDALDSGAPGVAM